ncbi:MAG: CDP-diacylglycerol--serine O-phosphatidyltransferase [Thermodesulfobacteriota bacterium]|nr:CDP-diacylglycerol--serine O-phosphatidyltransferase [Thermodesulfobacteriota bacterium]
MKKRTKINQTHMKKGIYILPNLFTTASLFCGFYSLIASLQGDYSRAAISIIIAFFFDGLDGKIARFTNTTSKFGAEYDSLSDLIAFGLAPAILAYSWALSPFGRYGWLAAFLFVVCGALRLARFNVQIGITESKVFNGLPIPAAAAVIATTVLLFYYLGGEGTVDHVSVLFGIVTLSLLMVSNIKYYSFKDLNVFSRKPFVTFFLIILIFIVIVLETQIMFFTVAVTYSLSGPVWQLTKLVKRVRYRGVKKDKYEHHEM